MKNTSKFFSNNKNKKKFDSLFLSHKIKRQYIKSKYIIHPKNPVKILWDTLIIFLVFYSVILIPFRLGLNVQLNPVIDALDSIYIPIFFAFDIMFTFNTAYYDSVSEQLVESRIFIIRKYIRGWFIIDLLASIPFDVISGLSVIRVIRLFRLNKMSQTFSELRKMLFENDNNTEENSNKHFKRSWFDYGILDMIFVFFQFLFLLHILACMWNFLTLPQSLGDPTHNWKTEFGYQNADITTLYVTAFYYNVITILTIGYGDIFPTNNTERIYSVFIMIAGVILFSILVSVIEGLMLRYNPRKYAYNDKMNEFKDFLKDTKVSNFVKDKARKAYSFYLESRSSFNEDDIFKDLTPDLKTEFIYNIYYNDIQKIKIFKGYSTENIDNDKKDGNPFNFLKSASHGKEKLDLLKSSTQSNKFDSVKSSSYNKENDYVSLGSPFPERYTNLVSQRGFVAHLFIHARPFQFSHNEVILKQGDMCVDIIFVLSGKIAIINKYNKNNLIAGFITDGNFFGDLEYQNNCVALATYKAIRPGVAVSVSFKDFKEALELYPKCATEFLLLIRERDDNFTTVLKEFTKKFSSSSVGSPESISINKRQSFIITSLNLFQGSNDDEEDENMNSDYILVNQKQSSFLFNFKKNSQIFYKSSLLWIDGELKEESKKYIEKYMMIKSNNNPFSDRMCRVVIFTPSHYEASWSIYNNDKEIEEGSVIEVPINYFIKKLILIPNGNIKYLWDLLVSLFILYCFIILPLEIAFDENLYKQDEIFQYVISAIFGFDLILSFRTAFYSSPFDAYIISGDMIAWKYLNGWFIFDLISALPIDLIVKAVLNYLNKPDYSNLRFLRLFRLLRIPKLTRFLKNFSFIDSIQERTGIPSVFFSITYILFELGIILHLLTCLWWGITYLIPGENFNEVLAVKVLLGNPNANLGTKYLAVLYFVMTTISSTGYGDITPTTTIDTILCIILAMIGATIFGFVIANIKTAFMNYGLSSKVANDRLSLIHQYLTEKKCSQQFAENFMVHFERKYKALKLYDVDEMVKKLPPRLGTKLLYSFYYNKIKLIPIFKYISNYTVALYIFQFLKPIYCDEGHIITKEGEPVENIYFFASGSGRCFKRYKKKKSLNRIEIKKKMEKSLRYRSTSIIQRPSTLSFGQSSTIFEESSISSSTPKEISRDNSKLSLVSCQASGDESESKTEQTNSSKPILESKKSISNIPHLELESLKIVEKDSELYTPPLSPVDNNTIQFKSKPRISDTLNLSSPFSDEKLEEKSTPSFSRPALKKRISSMTFDANDVKSAKSKINAKTDTLYNFSKIEKNFKRYSPQQLMKHGFELVTDLIQGDFFGYMGLLNAHKRKLSATYTPFSSKLSDSTKSSIHFNMNNLDGLSHEYSVCSTQPCTLYTLSIHDLHKIISTNKSIAIELQSAFSKAIVAQHREFKLRSNRTTTNKFIQVLKQKFSKYTQTIEIQDDASVNSLDSTNSSRTNLQNIDNSCVHLINENKKKLVNHFLDNNDLFYENDVESDEDPYLGYFNEPEKPNINLLQEFNIESSSNINKGSSDSSLKLKNPFKLKNLQKNNPSFDMKISKREMYAIRKKKLKAIKQMKQRKFEAQLKYYRIMNSKFSQLVEKTFRVSSINFHIQCLNNILSFHNDLIEYFNNYIKFNQDLFLDNTIHIDFKPIDEYSSIFSFNSKLPYIEYNKVSDVINCLVYTTNVIVECLPFIENFERFIKKSIEPLAKDDNNDLTDPSTSLEFFQLLHTKTVYIKENISILNDLISQINENIEKSLPIETNITMLPKNRNLEDVSISQFKCSTLKLQKIKFMNYFNLYKYKLAIKSYFNKTDNNDSVASRISNCSKESKATEIKCKFDKTLDEYFKKSCSNLLQFYSTNVAHFRSLLKFFVTPTEVLKKYYQPTYLKRSLSFSIVDANINELIYKDTSNDDFKFFNRRRSYTYPSINFNNFKST